METMMHVLQIEHAVQDYDRWKAAFDGDPAFREAGGVRRYLVFRPVDDPRYVAVDLEFDTLAEAESFKVALEGVWQSPQALAALGGAPKARIVDIVARHDY
jgi:hypothetical protein